MTALLKYLSLCLAVMWLALTTQSVMARESWHDNAIDHFVEDSCQARLMRGIQLDQTPGREGEAVDTLKLFLATCYWAENACQAFGSLGDAISVGATYESLLAYREYVRGVMFLNAGDCYYCSAVEQIAGTFGRYFDAQHTDNPNAQISIIDYLLTSGRCEQSRNMLLRSRKLLRETQLESYRDTVKDSLLTPIDTSKPSLSSLGLDWIMKVEGASHPYAGHTILSMRALENPFAASTTIVFELGAFDVMSLEVFDALGSRIWSEKGLSSTAGEHQVSVSLEDKPSGSYYARLSTSSGEVRTLKLIKRK